LRIGRAALAQLPRGGEAARVEPGEQPHQQPVARQALLRDQFAFLPHLLGAAVDRAVEGDGGKAPDSELVLRVPRRGERGRAGPQPIGRARGKARGGAGEMDRPCLGEVDQQHTLPLGTPAREALAAVLQLDAVERHGLVGCRQQVGRPDLAALVRRHQGKARAAFFVRRLADGLGLPPFCFQVVVFFGRQFSWLASRRDPCSFAS
jgi:hypothetical protein